MSRSNRTDWTLDYHDWNPAQNPLREALCTLGNGYFATRGAFEESEAGGPHYPGTYLAGGYNRAESEVAGRVIENEDLVNMPNWLWLTFSAADGGWLDLERVELLQFEQRLDMEAGLLERNLHFRDAQQREWQLQTRRLVHMRQFHLAAIQWTLTPLDWSGPLTIRTGLDGSVTNRGVKRYRALNGRHLRVRDLRRVAEDCILLFAETRQSQIRIAQAARTQVFRDGQGVSLQRNTMTDDQRIWQELVVPCEAHKPIQIEKTVALYTSRDHAISDAPHAAEAAVAAADHFDRLLRSHRQAWRRLWNRCNINLRDRGRSQFILRLHIFHLLQTISLNTFDLDVGVPARGWHGEAYRGHIFWDELFIFPLLNLRLPEITRSLLMYRYRRLDEARSAAAACGYRGAMFPWQSGSSGREESQIIHLNPKSGRWTPDVTHRQRHVGAAVAYNVWQYYQATGDIEFMAYYGAELILEIARFWASIAEYHPEHERYEIRGIVGPDEFHTGYPGQEEDGLNNNAYTNLMAVWTIRCALDMLKLIAEDRRQELIDELEITDEEFARWEDVSRRMFVPFHDGGILSQFEGYEQLEELPWQELRDEHGDIQRLDRLLEARGDSPNRYQAGKQADVLMLFYLFSSEELKSLITRLGYSFDTQTIPRAIDYYLNRTTHGSTLSRVVHSWVLARSDRQRAWQLFQDALESDIADVQGGTTSEGIHLGAMAGTVDLVQRCYTGIEMHDDVLWLDPCLPDKLQQIRMRLRYRGHWLELEITQQEMTVIVERSWCPPARVGFRGRVYEFHQAESRTFQLS